MKKINCVFQHPVALTIAKIAILLFIIDTIKKSFNLDINWPINHSNSYNFGSLVGIIANIAFKFIGSIVILRLLFKTNNFDFKAYGKV